MKKIKICLKGEFPTVKQLKKIGRNDLVRVIHKKYGGFREVRRRLNREKIKLDANYFEIIGTKEKAYWLGFLFADGWMYIRKNKPDTRQLGIEIHKKDEGIIDRFLKSLKAEGIEKHYRKNNDMVYIKVGNKKLTKDLINHGVVPNKSKTIKFPNLNSRELELAFLLGYYDGDGKKDTTRIASGSKKFLEKIKEKFQLEFKITKQQTKGITYRMILGAELFNEMMDNYSMSSPNKRRYFYTKEDQLIAFIEGGKSYRSKVEKGQINIEKWQNITKEFLTKLVWEKPSTQIALEYGISPSSIIKKCHKWNILKPPRGYWAKIKSKKV